MKKYYYNTGDEKFRAPAIWLAKKNNIKVGPMNYYLCLLLTLRASYAFREDFMRMWWIEFGSLLYIPNELDNTDKVCVIWPDNRIDLTHFLMRWA